MTRLAHLLLAFALAACVGDSGPECEEVAPGAVAIMCPAGTAAVCGDDARVECSESGSCHFVDSCGFALCDDDGPACSEECPAGTEPRCEDIPR